MNKQCSGIFPHAINEPGCPICKPKHQWGFWHYFWFAYALSFIIFIVCCAAWGQPYNYCRVNIPVASGGNGGQSDLEIKWDAWHKSIADHVAPYLKIAFDKAGWPAPWHRIIVKLSATPNHTLKAEVLSDEPIELKEAVEKAYNSLSGKDFLQYPEGSQRGDFTYIVTPTDGNAFTGIGLKNDVEQIHHECW